MHLPSLPSFLVRSSLLGLRVFQWISALIVMGISSYFIAQYDTVRLVVYEEVIVSVYSLNFSHPAAELAEAKSDVEYM